MHVFQITYILIVLVLLLLRENVSIWQRLFLRIYFTIHGFH